MLVEIIIVLVILALVFWLFDRYIVPVIPAPWGRIIMAIFAIIVIVFLLNRYVGLGL